MEPERERALSTGSASGGGGRPASHHVAEVVLDGAALLRIVKHCEDNLPGASTGALLGLDVPRGEGKHGVAMHVTYAFALPRGRGEDRDAEEGGHGGDDEATRAEYRRHMMKLLKEVNVDNNLVGWYRTMQLGHFSESGSKTEGGLRSQKTLFDCPPALAEDMAEVGGLALLYDPVQTAMGQLTVRAFRRLRAPASKEEAEAVGSFKDLLEEIPVTVRNPGIISALLFDMQEDARLRADFSKLDLSSSVYLSKNLELLSDEVDRMSSQLDRHKRFHTGGAGGGRPFMRDNRWNRRGREDEEDRNAEPNKVDTVLAAAQIGAYCEQISAFSKEGFSKLVLVGSLHKEAGAQGLEEAAAAAGLPAPGAGVAAAAVGGGGGGKSN